jgi:hypothetical protein
MAVLGSGMRLLAWQRAKSFLKFFAAAVPQWVLVDCRLDAAHFMHALCWV